MGRQTLAGYRRHLDIEGITTRRTGLLDVNRVRPGTQRTNETAASDNSRTRQNTAAPQIGRAKNRPPKECVVINCRIIGEIIRVVREKCVVVDPKKRCVVTHRTVGIVVGIHVEATPLETCLHREGEHIHITDRKGCFDIATDKIRSGLGSTQRSRIHVVRRKRIAGPIGPLIMHHL